MLVKIKSSHLDSVIEGNIYCVFYDEVDGERYILDENGDQTLFDNMVFKYKQIEGKQS
jgi:hypothetical protein